jgi:uncharacterized membrane protein
MNQTSLPKPNSVAKFAFLAAFFAICGIIDASYLTYHHYTAEPIPCTVTGGCEAVLNSSYATFGSIPIAIFGALAYLSAFILAIFTAFGKHKLWNLFGLQTLSMVCFSVWLVYLQIVVIEEICQYCMLSAGICLTLFVIFVVSKLLKTA